MRTIERHFCRFLRQITCGLALLLCAPAIAYEVEFGAVTVQDTFVTPAWTSVTFAQPFSVRPVVVALPTNQGGDPATIRIRNVSTAGFEILQVEPSGNDGPHVAMNTAYLAIEPGNHVLPDGNRLIVLDHSTSNFVSQGLGSTWDTVFFPSSFAGTPAIVAQIQTMDNESQSPPNNQSVPFLEVALRNVGSSQFQVALERAESTNGSVNFQERIGVIAITQNVDFSFADLLGNSIDFKAMLTPDNIQGWDNGCFTNAYPTPFSTTPLSVASQNRRDGNNGGWVRRCSESAGTIGLTVDEDIDNDSERNHTTESAGVIAASQGFHMDFGVDVQISKSVSVLSDPLNGTTNPFHIPQADVQYVIGVQSTAASAPDSNSLVVTDEIPAGIRLCVTAACQSGGPVVFDASGSPVPPGVSLGTVSYSNNGGASFSYTPIPDAEGFDDAVDAVQIEMSGQMSPHLVGGSPSFDLVLVARIN